MKHLLSIESLETADFRRIFLRASQFKKLRGKARHPQPLRGQSWALIFSKSSTRTRVSFEVGIRELGGNVVFLDVNDIQLGRGETIEDTARVLSHYLHGAVIRTSAQKDVEDFARFGSIPVINALTDDEHPCQILSDLFTIEERFGDISQRKIAFFGDGNCNVAHSWIFAAARLGFELRIASPKTYQPDPVILERAARRASKNNQKINIIIGEEPLAAATGADVLYTDVWVSMGREAELDRRVRELAPYQVNRAIVERARRGASVMHCLPAYRDKEISAEVFTAHAPMIFEQAANRLHVQKAIVFLAAQAGQ